MLAPALAAPLAGCHTATALDFAIAVAAIVAAAAVLVAAVAHNAFYQQSTEDWSLLVSRALLRSLLCSLLRQCGPCPLLWSLVVRILPLSLCCWSMQLRSLLTAAVTAAALAAAFTPGVTVAAVVLLQSLLRRFLCRTRCCARSQCCVAALAAAAVAVERKRNRYAVEHISCNNLLTYKPLTLSTHLFNAGAHTAPLPLQHWRENVVWLKLG